MRRSRSNEPVSKPSLDSALLRTRQLATDQRRTSFLVLFCWCPSPELIATALQSRFEWSSCTRTTLVNPLPSRCSRRRDCFSVCLKFQVQSTKSPTTVALPLWQTHDGDCQRANPNHRLVASGASSPRRHWQLLLRGSSRPLALAREETTRINAMRRASHVASRATG